jgi:hypothetical protein
VVRYDRFGFLLEELIRKQESAGEEDEGLGINNLWKIRIHE